MKECKYCLDSVCNDRWKCDQVMVACASSETYDKCKIEKCRACSARMSCDKKSWINLGGMV